jgi:carboxypeptidase C (cathepsin A)
MYRFAAAFILVSVLGGAVLAQQSRESTQPTQPQALPRKKNSKEKNAPQAPVSRAATPAQTPEAQTQQEIPPVPETKTPAESKGKEEEPQPGIEPNLKDEAPVITQHEIHVGGKTLKYTATAGRMPIKDANGKIVAAMFYVAYTVPGTPANPRPLTFSFNGGPGTSSIFVHIGALGPRRVVMQNEGWMPAPPYRLVDNEDTILDKTDIVLVDAIATGFSRAADEKSLKHYLSVQGDIEAFGEFIRMYIARNDRWNSPLYLVGESYGAFRSAGLSGYLIGNGRGIALNGIYLLSAPIDSVPAPAYSHGSDLPYVLRLPSDAMAAAYHHRLAPELAADLGKLRTDVENWAWNTYAVALAKGDRILPEEREAVIEQMSRYTGITKDVIDQANLRLDVRKFTHYLLLDQKLRIGRLDDRFAAPDPDGVLDTLSYDPTFAIVPPFTMVFNHYVRAELNYRTDIPYYPAAAVFAKWDWGSAIEGPPSAAVSLREALTKNPYMKIMVGEGYYDLATPFLAADYCIDHLDLPANLRKNITVVHYDSGHMVYLRRSDHDKFKNDVENFIEQSENVGQGAAQ